MRGSRDGPAKADAGGSKSDSGQGLLGISIGGLGLGHLEVALAMGARDDVFNLRRYNDTSCTVITLCSMQRWSSTKFNIATAETMCQ